MPVYIQRASLRSILIITILVTISVSLLSFMIKYYYYDSLPIEDKMLDSPELIKQLERIRKTRAIRILVTGKTGTGKSTLINGLVGEEVAEVGDSLDPETMKVNVFPVHKQGIDFIIYDSSGLQDGLNNEVEYMKDMEKTCKDVDLIFYTIKMTETRLGESEPKAMHQFTCAFGQNFWDHAIFVLTFANMVQDPSQNPDTNLKEVFEKKMNLWKKKLPEVLNDMDSKPCPNGDVINITFATINRIPILPAGHPSKCDLPGHEYWFRNIWMKSFSLLDDEAKVLKLKVNEGRFKRPREVKQDDFNKELYQQPIVVVESGNNFIQTLLTGGGAVLGAAIGGPFGAFAGASLGALLGS